MTKELVVVKLSGSIFSSPEFGGIVRTIKEVLNRKKQLFIILIAGGGATARKYIAAGKKLGLDQATLDELGIESSRLNGTLLVEALFPYARRVLPTTLTEVAEQLEMLPDAKGSRVLVCGGLHPGQSTNAVAALIAEKTKAEFLINATDVDGVYDKDPRRFNDAVLLKTVTVSKLSTILETESVQAGTYDLMDPVALKLISRSKIPTKIVRCKSSVLSRVLRGRKAGTEVLFQA